MGGTIGVGKKHILGCGGDTAHTFLMGGTIGVGTPHNIERIKVGTRLAGWVGGSRVIIVPLCGSIMQAETCQILSLAENPRWSRVWQKPCNRIYKDMTFHKLKAGYEWNAHPYQHPTLYWWYASVKPQAMNLLMIGWNIGSYRDQYMTNCMPQLI